MNPIRIKEMKMLFFFLVYVVPALTFTLSENVIKDDVEVDSKNLKSLYSSSPKLKGFRSSGESFGVSSRFNKGNISRQNKQQKGRNNRSSRNKKEIEEEKALQRAITFTNPMVPLQFRDTVKKKPKRKNLKPERLLRKMGDDFKFFRFECSFNVFFCFTNSPGSQQRVVCSIIEKNNPLRSIFKFQY